MTTSDLPQRLRSALVLAGFTYDAVAEALGPLAHAALGRNETTPGSRATAGGSALETLIRLFLLQTPVSAAAAEAALPGLVQRMAVEGILEQTVGEVAARMDVRPYASGEATGDRDLWVVSDLTPGLDGQPSRVGSDHVLGISSASTSLAHLTFREPVEVREGSFFEPVRGERFDLIATNPPFVISPATGERLVYRDSGLPGDRVVEDIVRAAPRHLNEGGVCQVLANWVIAQGQPWDERLAPWVADDCDALVVQREVIDPASYVELWL